MMALIAGLLAFAVEQNNELSGKQWAAGFLICAASILGLLLNYSHEARRNMHVNKMMESRHALEAEVSDRIKRVVIDRDKAGPSLRRLWMWIYVFTFIVGGALIVLADQRPKAVCSLAGHLNLSLENCRTNG
jgi:hypothetical protein